jgi:precorrin-2 dehydrogenase/sirohydrochlorin ferrochelatase
MRKTVTKSYYPVFLDLDGRKCVVIGGGNVALRKVESLLENNAVVSVVSPEVCAELEQVAAAGKISVQRRVYHRGDLQGAFVVVAATNDNFVNNQIAAEARELSVLLNVVDDAEKSNFIVPASVRRGEVIIAVSTSGRSPALARKIKMMLEQDFGEEYAALALVVNDVRRELKENKITVSAEAWQKALDVDALTELLRNGKTEKARSILRENLQNARLEEN